MGMMGQLLSNCDMARFQEQCAFSWDEFGENIKQSFSSELEKRNFSDVTLACEDGQYIQAHKIVLSSGSLFFSDILLRTKHPQPFIYLKGMMKDKLKNIIDFLYTGESTVEKENLDDFLKISQELKVKGLERNVTAFKLEGHTASQQEIQVEEEQSEQYISVGGDGAFIEDLRDEVGAKESDDTYENAKICEYCGETVTSSKKIKGHKIKHKCQAMEEEKVAKFLPKWLNLSIQGVLLSTWLAPDPANTSRAMCTMCPKNPTFSINDGRKAIKQHHNTGKHQESVRKLK